MKEATGELSTTVIAIVAIAAILAIFTAFLLPTLKQQIALNQACAGGPGYSTADIECSGDPGVNQTFNCGYYEENVLKATKTCHN